MVRVPITSDLTSQETWNLARVGILPLQLVLGVSVYSVGVVGSFSASVRGLVRGEIPELTNVLYEARTNAMERMAADAARCGADGVLGVQTYVYDMGEGVVEFLAIGTAVKQVNGSSTRSNSLPTQVVIKDEETFTTMNPFNVLLNDGSGATESLSGGGSLGGFMFLFGLWILIIGGMALFVFVAPFRHFVVQFFR